MTHSPPPPKLTLLPETAPFTPEQRAWLDGFFVATLGLADSGITPLSPEAARIVTPNVAASWQTELSAFRDCSVHEFSGPPQLID